MPSADDGIAFVWRSTSIADTKERHDFGTAYRAFFAIDQRRAKQAPPVGLCPRTYGAYNREAVCIK